MFMQLNKKFNGMNVHERRVIEKNNNYKSALTLYEDISDEMDRAINSDQATLVYENFRHLFSFDPLSYGLLNCNNLFKAVINENGFAFIDGKLNYFSKDAQIIIEEDMIPNLEDFAVIKQSDVAKGVYYFPVNDIEERTSCTIDNYVMWGPKDNRKLRTTVNAARGYQLLSNGLYLVTVAITIDVLPLKKSFGFWNNYSTSIRHSIKSALQCTLNGSEVINVNFNSYQNYETSSGKIYVSDIVSSSNSYSGYPSESFDFTLVKGWSNSTPFDSRDLDNNGSPTNNPNNGIYYDCD